MVACLKAGINQFLDQYKDETKAALKDGSITEAEIDDLLRPKFRVTIRLGLLDPPEMVPYSKVKDAPEPWNTDADRAVSRKMALESVVLLKNANGFLPLKKESIKSIAVIGPLANSVHWDWYGGTPPYAITPLRESGTRWARTSRSTMPPMKSATPPSTRRVLPTWQSW